MSNVLTASGRIVPLPLAIETVCPAGTRVHYLDFLIDIGVRCKRILPLFMTSARGA